MWITLTLLCAFVQSLWMALSKSQLQALPATRFMLYFRVPVVATLLCVYVWRPAVGQPLKFWGWVLLAAAVECIRLLSFAHGAKKDYYATYSLKNMAPIFVLLLAPRMLGEQLSLPVVAGALCVVTGGFVFYRAGRFHLAGVIAAAAQGGATTICRLGFSYLPRESLWSPVQFVAPMYFCSTAMLFVIESVQACRRSHGAAKPVDDGAHGPATDVCIVAGLLAGVADTVRGFAAEIGRILPLSALNVAAVVTFIYGLHLAPAATHFTIVFRSSLIFGFILSLVLLKEFERWPAKLCGASFILGGTLIIALSGPA